MKKLEVFDLPLCCKTGICGHGGDQALVTFASDLEWLKHSGVEVVRYGLSFNPAKFIENNEVKNLLCKRGNSCLPILIFNQKFVSDSRYPSRKELAKMCNVEYNQEEAPPIHREENCCCGEDCDCGSVTLPEGTCPSRQSNDNSVAREPDFYESEYNPKTKMIILAVVLLIMAALIIAKALF